MSEDNTPHFWCKDGNGQISMPGKRRIVSHSYSRSDMRVQAALAHYNRRKDCRNKSLYEMCLVVCVFHVNSIKWDNVRQHIAADILSNAHRAGTIADSTVVKLSTSCVQSNFVTGLNLSRQALHRTWAESITLLKEQLTFLDLSNSTRWTDVDWVTKCITKLTKLLWLDLSGTNVDDSDIKKLVYPSKYCHKGLQQLRYLDISGNDKITDHGKDLAGSLPSLQVLITETTHPKYFLFPSHSLVNWGHDIVVRWVTGELPSRKPAEHRSSFYNSRLEDTQITVYKELVLDETFHDPLQKVVQVKQKPKVKPLHSSMTINNNIYGSDISTGYKRSDSVSVKRKRLLIKETANDVHKRIKNSNNTDDLLLKSYTQPIKKSSVAVTSSLFAQLNKENGGFYC